ncbi:MAG: hypothetical protein INR62_08350 [Rhodospirillales bacterium]|nr:hypothetical protein [Acetobacter sp.]
MARTLDGVNLQQVSADLTAAGYLYKRGSQYRVRAPHRGVLFTEKADPIKGFVTIYVTPAGAAAVAHLYEAGRLTMRKGAAKAA